MRQINIFVLLLILFLFSCSNPADSNQDDLVRLQTAIDSIKPDALIVTYIRENGFSLIYKSENESYIRKTYLKDLPMEADTLIRLNSDSFKSTKYPYAFVVKDSSVSEIFLRKIVHPSSNWQGQTPGLDSVVMKYKCIDRKILNEKKPDYSIKNKQ